jgi:aryl-alcohol dehydrogenase-like predicted oxidoreductase
MIARVALGDSGLEVSRLGVGGNNFGWRLDRRATRAIVDAALDEGVNFLETADMYGRNAPGLAPPGSSERGDSERLLGAALAGRRERVVLATKFGADMGDGESRRGSPDYVRRATEASLARLGTDYIDLLYYHRPDGITPLEETIGAMAELVDAGKVRAIGASNLDAAQLRLVGSRICALQNRLNLLDQDAADLLEICAELEVGFVPYSPLADGLLSGKYHRGEAPPAGSRLATRPPDDERFARVEGLSLLADARGLTLLELAVGWLCAHAEVASVIAGVTSPQQLRANAAAAQTRLDAADLAAIASAGLAQATP